MEVWIRLSAVEMSERPEKDVFVGAGQKLSGMPEELEWDSWRPRPSVAVDDGSQSRAQIQASPTCKPA